MSRISFSFFYFVVYTLIKEGNLNIKKKLSYATITTISTSLCIVMFFVCSYLFDHQILFTNQCKPTFNYFDDIEKLIILLALLDPIIYAIFVYLLPEYSKKAHDKTNTTLKRILFIFLSFLWISTILSTLFSYVSSAYLVLGIYAAYAFPFLFLISSFYYLSGNHS